MNHRLSSLLALGAAAFLLSGCTPPAAPLEPVRAVKLFTVGTDALQSAHEYAAEVRPRVESRLGFRVGGKIVRRQAEVGQKVAAGQVLAELDARDYRLAADAAQAQVSAARTNRDLAEADLRRFRNLKEQNFISGAELDRREATYKAAQAQLEQAQSQLSSLGNQTSYATLVADKAGIVTAVEAEAGQVVSAGTPVVRLAEDGPRDVVFAVPEDKVAAITVGASVRVRVWSSQTDLTGRVREVASSADPQTRTFTVKVALEGKGAPALGSTVYAIPMAGAASGMQVIKLPTTALKKDGAQTAVWVLDTASMTVKSRVVQVATADGNLAVIASGVAPGERIVSAGVHVLAPGQKVSIYQDPVPQSAVTQPAASK